MFSCVDVSQLFSFTLSSVNRAAVKNKSKQIKTNKNCMSKQFALKVKGTKDSSATVDLCWIMIRGAKWSEYSSKNDEIVKRRVDGDTGQLRMDLQQHEFS